MLKLSDAAQTVKDYSWLLGIVVPVAPILFRHLSVGLTLVLGIYLIILIAYILIPWPHHRWRSDENKQAAYFRQLIRQTHLYLLASVLSVPLLFAASYQVLSASPGVAENLASSLLNKATPSAAITHRENGAGVPAEPFFAVHKLTAEKPDCEVKLYSVHDVVEQKMGPVLDVIDAWAAVPLVLVIIMFLGTVFAEILGTITFSLNVQ